MNKKLSLESYCKECAPKVHCCIFKNNNGFTFLAPSDAKKIKRKIKKDYEYFIDYTPLPKKVIDDLKNDDPSLEGRLRFSQLDKNKILRLKTKKDKRCIFLNNNGKCEIYSVRPNICRIFPYWAIRLNNKKLKIIAHDLNPKCRIIISNSKIDEKQIKNVFKKIEKESLSYKKDIKKFVKKNNF